MKNKAELFAALNKTIIENNNNRIILTKLEQFLLNRNVSIGEINPYWMGNKDLMDASDITIFNLTYALYDITENQRIKPELFFSPTEIKDGLSWRKEISDEKLSLPLDIMNVTAVTDNQWITVIDIQSLKRWYYELPIVYNFNTQRYAKLKKSSDGSIIKIKSTNPKSISEISDRLLRNRQFPDTITLNLLSDGNDQIAYDSKKRVLTIYSGEINTLDGDHRISGILEYLNKNPECAMTYELRITNFDEETAKRFQEQVQTVNHFSKIQREVLKAEKASNRCVKRIMSSQSDLGKLIAENPSLIKVGECLVPFTTVSSALHYIFDFNEQMLNREIYQIADWVSEVIDEIIGLYPIEFIESKLSSKKNTYIAHENMFIGYIGLAKELRGKDNWRVLLQSALDKIDFGFENPIWTDLKITSQRSSLNKSYIKKICDYFVNELG